MEGRVVRKPINANPGLMFNAGSYFSSRKAFLLLILSDRLKATNFKTWGKKGSTGIFVAWLLHFFEN